MPDHHRRADDGLNVDAEVRRMILQKIAHDLKRLYQVETQLPSWMQAFLQQLDEQQEQNREI
jgi:hypothetical protein